MGRQSNESNRIAWLAVLNSTTETIPPYALIQTAGVNDKGVYVGSKPNADSLPGLVINGPIEIPKGLIGSATYTPHVYAAYDDSGSPEVGQCWGSKEDEWKLFPNQFGFRIDALGEDKTKLVLVTREGCNATVEIDVVTNVCPVDPVIPNGSIANIKLADQTIEAGKIKDGEVFKPGDTIDGGTF